MQLFICLFVCLFVFLFVFLFVCMLSVCSSVWLSICLSVCLSVCVSVCSSVCSSICSSVCSSICLFAVRLPVCLSVQQEDKMNINYHKGLDLELQDGLQLFICLFVHLFIYIFILFVYLFICLFICLPVCAARRQDKHQLPQRAGAGAAGWHAAVHLSFRPSVCHYVGVSVQQEDKMNIDYQKGLELGRQDWLQLFICLSVYTFVCLLVCAARRHDEHRLPQGAGAR